ncbi:hypothetical protein D3C79_1051370 [compost metagenome]
MGLFDFVQQHHAIGALPNSFGEYATLTVTHIARRRALELADGVRLLVLGHVERDQRLLATEQTAG